VTAGRKPRGTGAGKNKRNTEATKARTDSGRRCGLCGKTRSLTRTECCGQWICDDEHKYVLFSYAHTSCFRNHRRYTLCGYHSAEEHTGDWRECQRCRNEIQTEMYVYYGTNEPRWTPQNRPYVDGAKPAIGRAPKPREL